MKYETYVGIDGKPCKWEPTPELRWYALKDGRLVLQQRWGAKYESFLDRWFGAGYKRNQWRDISE